jgi:hypothetical protein
MNETGLRRSAMHLSGFSTANLMLSVATLGMGCATVQYRDVRTTDKPVGKVVKEVPKKGAAAEVRQSGSTVVLTVAQACDRQEFRNVARTVDQEAFNASPTADYVALGAGILLAGAGVGTYVDAPNVYPKDENSRQYNPIGPGPAKAMGIGSMAAGGTLLLIPIIDAVRAAGTESVRSSVTTGPRRARSSSLKPIWRSPKRFMLSSSREPPKRWTCTLRRSRETDRVCSPETDHPGIGPGASDR